ncbi:MAG: AMP-binding protein [Alphaproteobacteria bacterium]|nr:AMP-binding protein [Alphaproteobacteria bacterium]
MDQKTTLAPFMPIPHAEPRGRMTRRPDGSIIVENLLELGPYERNVVAYLHKWAQKRPGQVWLAQRAKDRSWETVTYAEGLARVNALSQALLDRGLDQAKPLMILSGNSINHALLVMAALQVGVPASPVATAYSTMPGAHAKLHHVFDLIEPKLLFVEQGTPFEAALGALDLAGVELVVHDDPPRGFAGTPFADLLATTPTDAVRAAYERTGPDTVGKYLFTSGSTGMPKGVPQTQRMMCSNQKAGEVIFPNDPSYVPVIVDWLPWNHCYGGNSNFNGILREGGSLYIDDGKPVPELVGRTLDNLREIAPTEYLSVAAGHAMVVHALEEDEGLRRNFFSRMRKLGYGGASLPHEVWQRYQDLAVRETGQRLLFRTGWGSTETAPVSSTLYWPIEGTGNVGLPMPGTTLKLVPNGDKLEVRVKGDNIFPGYYRQPEKTADAFDEEGFYKIGDAMKLVDETDINKGLIFNGRVVEDFKLLSGTFVSVGTLRVQVNDACAPLVADNLVAGHDRDHVGVLLWPNLAACRRISGAGDDIPVAELIRHPRVVEHVRKGLQAHNRAFPGSSTRVVRAMLMEEPPSMGDHEITEKGYVNQRAALDRRADLVAALFAASPGPDVIDLRA